MSAKKVVTKGGGRNLFKVSESGGIFYVYKYDGDSLFGGTTQIGKTSNFEDALSIIKSYSGKGIEKISNW